MPNIANTIGFHDLSLVSLGSTVSLGQSGTQFTYTFQNFFHPFVGELIAKLNRDSLTGMLGAAWQEGLKTPDPKTDPTHDFFHTLYNPTDSQTVKVVSFPKEIDVAEGGPYANYNWELFFHIPLTIAVHLSKNQRFAEAQRWFHYIFDPTSNDHSVEPPQRFWKFLAFRQDNDPKQIDALLALLSKPPAELSSDDRLLRDDILQGYQAILDKPFQPHAVARTRHLAYQYCVVMKYLDNLIAWGDHLFQQDTIETINEATQLYVLASNLLGPRPQRIPPRGTVQPKTFAQLKAKGLDPMGNALVELESKFPFNLGTTGSGGSTDGESAGALFGIGRTLYFCIPRNDKLLSYWDTVADRLFKIRHCMNIQGVVRPLALFDPPIDPGMLVKATAAGLDLSSIVSGLTQPVGPVRCLIFIQKALELCAEVRGLGNSLLSAMEKGDAEHLALVRQRHEIQIQQMAQEVRFLQWKSAQETTTSLLTSRKTALERLHYYQRLLGLPADQNAPETLPLDRRELTEENFDEAYGALVGQYDNPLTLQQLADLKIVGDTAPAPQAGASGQGRLYLNTNEDADLNVHGPSARDDRHDAMRSDTLTGVLALLPDMGIDMHFWGLGGHANLFGGSLLAAAGRSYSSLKNTSAMDDEGQGVSASKTASYQRRADDEILQYNLAAHELMQIGRQILTSLIAEQIAHHEYQSMQQQIANAQEVDQFLHDKFTNEDLYLWMQGEISRLYYEYYRFAFDTARKAERTMKQELMRPEVDAQDFVKFNYWDGGRKGLLSGEALYLDIKRIEMAYHENNKREYELTRHVSLRQLNPAALLALKATGSCQVSIPEWVFDLDTPGHYMRRIKTVGITIPCVAGPYTSVSCTLTLTKSSLRKSPLSKDGEYARQGSEDDRFVDYFSATQSIVTSTGQNDSGMFETNLRDERFLPFEGAGAESTWKLEMPADFRQFDYSTISDVILHIRYTAREDGALVRTAAVNSLKTMVAEVGTSGLGLLFSLRHDFPTEWAAFVNSTTNAPFTATVRKDYFPYFTQGKPITITGFELYGQDGSTHHPVSGLDLDAVTSGLNDPTQAQFTLTAGADEGEPKVLTRKASEQVLLIIRYSLEVVT